MRFYHYIIATVFGSGFSPIAPGTVGSIAGALIFWFIPLNFILQIFLALLFFFAGVWSSSFVEREKGKDPGLVNIDEVVGQWIALLLIPHRWPLYLAAFVLFRLFDIWKPWPIDRLQDLKSGWGIMIDDVLAGIYALIILQFLIYTGVF